MGIRGKCVFKIQEYDLDIRSTQLIKGQVLAKMLTQGNEVALGMACQNKELEKDPWYADVILFILNITCPSHLKGHTRIPLRLKYSNYCITQEGLGWRNPDGIILRCVNEQESKQLLTEFHARFCGGHCATDTTTHKILRVGYGWPSLFVDVQKFVMSCPQCHLFMGKQRLETLPL